MKFIMDLTLILCGLYMAISYMVIVRKIRDDDPGLINNFNIINILYIYREYIKIRKKENNQAGLIFYSHLASILITTILGIFLDGTQPFR